MNEYYRVLHVDDEPDFTTVTAEYLEQHNDRFKIESATSASEGLETLDQGEFDCIVSDYEMPVTNGIEFLEAIREEYPDLPFILFTGKGTEAIASQAISAGVTDYLQKKGRSDQFTVLANRIEKAIEKYRTERELETTRRQYQRVTEQNLVGIYLIQDGEFVYVNPRLADIHGYDRTSIIGMSPLDLIVPEERDRVRQNLQRRIDGTVEDIHYETVGLTEDGDRIDIELHGSQITHDGEPAVIGTELDITERKEQERELKQAKRRLDLALQEAQTGTWEWNLDTDELYWSEELLDLLAISAEEFDGDIETFQERLHPDDEDRVEAAIEETIETHGQYRVEHRLEDADGEYHWIDVRGQFVEDQGSRSIVGVGIDITERKEQERLLREQRDRLDKLASTLSHDLRNPLQVADSRLELVQRECDSEHLDRIDIALERMKALISDLLILAREEESATEPATVDLPHFTEDCWQTVDTAGATLVAAEAPTIRADESKLTQLFENLIRNAVENGGPDVTVTVGGLADGFYFEDDGPGIPEADREKVFDHGYSTAEQGTGFGLSIVKRIVEAHDWDIQLTAGSDGGARFEITGVDVVAE